MVFTTAARLGGPLFRVPYLIRAAYLGAAFLWVLAPVESLAQTSAEAPGFTVETAQFVVSVGDGAGGLRTFDSDLVPYMPDRACFGWRIRLADAPPVIRYREVLKLPTAPEFWSGENDEYSPHSFSADRTTAITEEFTAPDDGWISSSWCIAEGDPTGAHSIEVYIEGQLIRHFDFEVKKLREATNN